MSEHGFLKPNPILFDLEKRKPKLSLGHEQGLGAPCNQCGAKCSGFELHFWKKVCQNCRCGKIEHGVVEQEDHGQFLVGKIFDRPLRTREEEHAFMYGDVMDDDNNNQQQHQEERINSIPGAVKGMSQFIRSLEDSQGHDASVRRIKQLEKQFPLHDVAPDKCHELSPGEVDRMTDYVDNVRRNVAGQGIVTQLTHHGDILGDKRHQGNLRPPSPPTTMTMPPPMKLLPIVTGKYEPRQSPAKTRAMSPRSQWSCGGCQVSMAPGEVAIFAERAGRDKCWHPACFSCSECGEVLEDLLYYYSYGQLFCGRHFASKMNIPRCSACDELIFSSEYTAAEDRYWHVKHFCCWICDKALAGHKYIPVEGMPHCLDCWQSHFGKTCQTCNSLIHPQDQRVSLGDRHWHTSDTCFKCGVCNVSLMGAKMCVKQGLPLCSSACAASLSSHPSHTSEGLLSDNLGRLNIDARNRYIMSTIV